ncbi:MAG TPA: DUF3775 domain-containing protein [Dongiaceae bacterium]|nr:DUF3775 domain-containing protein [Dongiaceae bacterium]
MEATPEVELTISPDKLAFIIVKAREFDAKVEPVEPDPGSNPADDDEREVLEDYADDPTREELVDALENLNEDEIVEVIALTWLGRGDYEPEDWEQALSDARETHDERAVSYLVGTPNLADEIEEGLSRLGLSVEDLEQEHL